MINEAESNPHETQPDAEDDYKPVRDAEFWTAELAAGAKELEKFSEQGRRATRRYTDKRDINTDMMRLYNLFHSNVNTLMSVLYGKLPKPFVDREFQDADDDVARVAALILQRLLTIKARCDFDMALRQVVFDRLVPGLGCLWFRYCADFENCSIAETVDPATGTVLVPAYEYKRVTSEWVASDYVYWEDICWSPARTWEEVTWVARRHFLRKDEFVEMFGEQFLQYASFATQKARYGRKSGEVQTPQNDKTNYAEVSEVWCKTTKTVYWVMKGAPQVLKQQEDPLKRPGFWPCPKPLMANLTNSNLVPKPDYAIAYDQYSELDQLNARINLLVDAVKVIGVYDSTATMLTSVLSGTGNKMVPVDNWAMFADKGGLKGVVDWFPLDQVVAAIDKLRAYRQDVVAQLYEVTGISDVVRGATKASETATAQNIKAQFAGMRLQAMQLQIASFVEEACEIMAWIMVNHFSDQTIITRSNVERTTEAELVPQALQLLRSPMFAQFRILVTADQLAVPDFMAERDERVNFLRAIGGFLEAVTPVAQAMPGSMPYLLQMLQWAAAGFKSSHGIESVLDKAVNAATMAAKQPAQPDPQKIADVKKTESETIRNVALAKRDSVEAAAAGHEMVMDTASAITEHMIPSGREMVSRTRQ